MYSKNRIHFAIDSANGFAMRLWILSLVFFRSTRVLGDIYSPRCFRETIDSNFVIFDGESDETYHF